MSEPADLILHGGRVWTVDPERPEARAVAVRGDRFVAVGPEQEVLGLRGPATQVIELGDRLALPGFIDAHTHFENAAAWLFRVSLYEVGDAPLAIDKVAAAAQLVPEGLWITGGDLGAADAWVADRAGRPRPAPPAVDRSALDRAALEDLRRVGITSIHDVARLPEISRTRVFHTDVERSATDLDIFRELQRRDQLTIRVYAFLTLAVWRDIVKSGIRPRSDDGLI